MKLKNFPIKNGNSYSARNGSALIDLEMDAQQNDDQMRSGSLGIYESGERLHGWRVKITQSGIVFCAADDFYIALELFSTITDALDK